jgi:hypothetical protein
MPACRSKAPDELEFLRRLRPRITFTKTEGTRFAQSLQWGGTGRSLPYGVGGRRRPGRAGFNSKAGDVWHNWTASESTGADRMI